jgi:hypothetical protein
MPFDNRTRAIFRRAELGFLGVVVVTLRQTPRLKGPPMSEIALRRFKVFKTTFKAGALDFPLIAFLGFLTS